MDPPAGDVSECKDAGVASAFGRRETTLEVAGSRRVSGRAVSVLTIGESSTCLSGNRYKEVVGDGESKLAHVFRWAEAESAVGDDVAYASEQHKNIFFWVPQKNGRLAKRNGRFL